MIKKCRKCGETKPLEEFKTDVTCINGKAWTCRVCVRAHGNKYYHQNKNKPEFKEKKKATVRRHDLKRNYGATPELFDEMLARQQGGCAICGEKKEYTLHVDHCHTTMKIRGLLCHSCNVGIGHFKDDTNILEKAIKYLIKHK